ncbi:MAG: DUF1998 domain-containing protein [candidate division WOR-3 bacterium]
MRLSQFVFTWGPGSILESLDGPRVIPAPDIGLFGVMNLTPGDFEISDRRLTESLLGGSRIFRLPQETEGGRYMTRPFPSWKFCSDRHSYAGRSGFSVVFRGNSCPLCGGRGAASRFIMACPQGHMDDVNWAGELHGRGSRRACQQNWFMLLGTGGALSRMVLECPACRARMPFRDLYDADLQCTGRYPERERVGEHTPREECMIPAKIIQRQASNLRIPVLQTVFSIPPMHTILHNRLEHSPVYHGLVASGIILGGRVYRDAFSRSRLETILRNLVGEGVLREDFMDDILVCSDEDILKAIEDVAGCRGGSSYRSLLMEEFRTFIRALDEGIPPLRSERPPSPVLIEVNPELGRHVRAAGVEFCVVPVLRLRSITVQRGYLREVGNSPAVMVDVSFRTDSGVRWYPGIELFGEGIFITLRNAALINGPEGEDAERWYAADPLLYPRHLFRDDETRDELHPGFVLWHTLSHLLIRAISVEAGYPSASLRERVYFEPAGQRSRGGVLIYAVQPGSDGTMGGLLSMVPIFDRIMNRALEMLVSCSGDPLCLETRFQSGHYAGASCCGCLFISETSCEHRNMWLDRRVLLSFLT